VPYGEIRACCSHVAERCRRGVRCGQLRIDSSHNDRHPAREIHRGEDRGRPNRPGRVNAARGAAMNVCVIWHHLGTMSMIMRAVPN